MSELDPESAAAPHPNRPPDPLSGSRGGDPWFAPPASGRHAAHDPGGAPWPAAPEPGRYGAPGGHAGRGDYGSRGDYPARGDSGAPGGYSGPGDYGAPGGNAGPGDYAPSGGYSGPGGYAPPGGYPAPGAGQSQQWPSPSQPWGGPPGTGYPGPYATPQPPPRRRRGPVIGVIVGAVVIALGAGGYAIAHALSNSGNNRPIATSTHAVTGGTSISGHGITMTFPKGWQNVPTSPNDFEHFIKVFESKYGHVPAALQSEMSNPQLLHSFAMLVYKFGANGSVAENLNALVTSAVATPSQMMAELKSGQGPAQFGAKNIQYRITSFATHPSLLITYTVSTQGASFSGAQAYVDGPASMAVVTVTSSSVGTSESDLKQIVSTIKFS